MADGRYKLNAVRSWSQRISLQKQALCVYLSIYFNIAFYVAKFTPSEGILLPVPASSLHGAAIWIFASEWPVAAYWFLQHPSIWFMFAPENSLWHNRHAPSCTRDTQQQQVHFLFKVLLASKSISTFRTEGFKTACVFVVDWVYITDSTCLEMYHPLSNWKGVLISPISLRVLCGKKSNLFLSSTLGLLLQPSL